MLFFFKNFIYSLIGYIYLIYGYFKYSLLQYRRPRLIMADDVESNLKYDFKIINNFEDNFKKLKGFNYDYQNKHILELGPGPDLGTGLIFRAKGATNYLGVDKFDLLAAAPSFYEAVINSLGDNINKEISELKERIIKDINTGKEKINLAGFKYLNCSAEELDFPDQEGGIDLIFSNAVLEHIENPEKFFRHSYLLLRKGGVMYHEIDFQTHIGALRDRDPLNILKFNSTLYNFLKYPGSLNRLRANNFKIMAEKVGFKNIKILELSNLNIQEVNAARPYLAREFKNRTAEELKVLSAVLMAEK